jgi:hypothetical protein
MHCLFQDHLIYFSLGWLLNSLIVDVVEEDVCVELTKHMPLLQKQ